MLVYQKVMGFDGLMVLAVNSIQNKGIWWW